MSGCKPDFSLSESMCLVGFIPIYMDWMMKPPFVLSNHHFRWSKTPKSCWNLHSKSSSRSSSSCSFFARGCFNTSALSTEDLNRAESLSGHGKFPDSWGNTVWPPVQQVRQWKLPEWNGRFRCWVRLSPKDLVVPFCHQASPKSCSRHGRP